MNNKKKIESYSGLYGIEPVHKGKVRDIYDLGDKLLIVVSDRISAYDSILPTLIPGKGVVLNMISAKWFDWFDDIPNHKISTDVNDYPDSLKKFASLLKGRSMLVRKAERIDLECIVRGYITGSGWREYCELGSVCGISLPGGLKDSQKLEEPIFTPSTKADSGHDENITVEKAASIVGSDTIERIKQLSLRIFTEASRYASGKGILIADTKFEFGFIDGEIAVIDEILTPDSSRFWLTEEYQPGRKQRSLDKQFIRDYLDESGWNHEPPAPELPLDIVQKTTERYKISVERLFDDIDLERYGV
ncbi:phosphoribosylaminoimidazolesuccinocarboxamide synthase [bacterium]|nr:phosphoribosylaminoimidazolesuccinocarboxamide synthase [bacterium]